MKAPYISYDDVVVYPTLKYEASREGNIKVNEYKKLMVLFNCLGVVTRTTMVLHIYIPKYKPINLVIDKWCSNQNFINRLAEKVIVREGKYMILTLIFVCVLLLFAVYLIITCCNLCRGKSLVQAVPCGGKIVRCVIGSEKDNVSESKENSVIAKISTSQIAGGTELTIEHTDNKNTYGSL